MKIHKHFLICTFKKLRGRTSILEVYEYALLYKIEIPKSLIKTVISLDNNLNETINTIQK